MAGDGETTPDITLVPGDSYGKVKWNVLDTIGSDHLPIKVTVEGRERKEKVKRRLNLEKLDVNKYQNTFSELLKEARTEENLSLEKEFKIFVDLVLRAAQKSAPLTSSKPKKTWWTEECTTARKKMKTAFKQMRKNPCEEQRNQYQQARDTLFDTIKSSKRKAWREFASTLSPRTPSSKVWGVLKSIDGRKKQKLPDVPLTAGDKTVKILGVEIDSQCTFKTQAVNATRKLKERNQVLSCMAGKSWGLKGSDIRHTYKAYTRPGGLYGCGVWGPFIAQTNLKKLETCNTRAARLITGCPSGSNNANTLAEAQLPTIATFIKDEAVRQYSKLLEFPEGHHLKELTRTAYTRARLKSRGDAEYRKDWRRTAEEHYHQLQITNTKETKNKLQQTEEMRIKNDYLAARKEGSDYDRTCRGDPPPVLLVPHSREDEVFVHQLRVNRCPILAECKHRFGKIPEPQCPHCNLEEETALHFLTKCPKWKKQRKKAGLPTNPFETPEKILDFAKDTGVYPSS